MIEAYNIKNEFTSMVSHELRTPLTAIMGGINIVLDGSAGFVNEEQRDFLDTARRNVDRLARLINDVLDYQKLDSGRMEFRVDKRDINTTVEEVREYMSTVAQNKGLELKICLEENLPEINFDKDKIIQILTNLVGNAIKFTDKGSIAITTRKAGNAIIVSVKDTGVGIKKENMHKLFQGFSQIATGKERKPGSTGLGLTISKKIIHQHKGKIWVESEYGKGSTFSFLLPIVERRY